MAPGPEGIRTGDTFVSRDGAHWEFTGFNDVAGRPFALDRDGWPVLVTELLSGQEWRHRRPAHPVTTVEIQDRARRGRPIGTAQAWPRDEDGWADTFEVTAIDPGLRRVWLIHTGRYRESTGQLVWRPDDWRHGPLAVVHAVHIGALARLTLWYEHSQQAMYRHRDREGRWL